MSLATLQLTQFSVQKLQCIGGTGRAVPYRITTYRGGKLGEFGEVMEFTPVAANDELFSRYSARLLRRMVQKVHHSLAGSARA